MRAENDLFLVWGSTSLVFVLVVEIDVGFLACRIWLGFIVSIEIGLDLVWMVEIDWISVWGMELYMILV